ncbi:hypothetical protein CDAR_468841 [Caerostris darwini]|uniref:Uncharacterized protein n=1 Tax=Caerostris darwini TaxID=1538125 RepID=A0AAV4R5P8_9ARAC|nr:hypothetical protein CDAR_468841 [Caerostris darwini]
MHIHRKEREIRNKRFPRSTLLPNSVVEDTSLFSACVRALRRANSCRRCLSPVTSERFIYFPQCFLPLGQGVLRRWPTGLEHWSLELGSKPNKPCIRVYVVMRNESVVLHVNSVGLKTNRQGVPQSKSQVGEEEDQFIGDWRRSQLFDWMKATFPLSPFCVCASGGFWYHRIG